MDVGLLDEIGHEAIYVLISISAPVLILSLVVGLIISLLQALTQIQETTLTFVPKILTIYLSLLIYSALYDRKAEDFYRTYNAAYYKILIV